jgi:hypothetical protein
MVVKFTTVVPNIPVAMASAIRVETNPVYGFYGLMIGERTNNTASCC